MNSKVSLIHVAYFILLHILIHFAVTIYFSCWFLLMKFNQKGLKILEELLGSKVLFNHFICY